MAEVKKQEQTMRYSDLEISLIKNTFCENDALIKVLRKVFLQGTLDNEEMKIVRMFTAQPESMRLLRKTLLPEIDLDAPSFQMVDLHVNIDTKEHTMDRAYPLMLARDLMCDYLAQQFNVLADKNPKITIEFAKLHRSDGKDIEKAFVELSMRNTLISHVEFQLMQLKTLAGRKDETAEETLARLKKDSNK